MRRVLTTTLAWGMLVAAAGCTSDSEDEPSAPMTEITIECDEYADAAERIAMAQTALYSGEDPAALDTLLAELEELRDGAPEEVRAALSDLADGYRSAQDLLADPTEEDKQELAEIAPELAEDSETVTAYIVEQCQG